MRSMKMKRSMAIIVLLSLNYANAALESTKSDDLSDSTPALDIDTSRSLKKLSRTKRFLAFPEGSSFSVAFCTSLGVTGNPNAQLLSWAINWGLAYDLPNSTFIFEQRDKKAHPKPIVQRRQRRDLYQRLEVAMDSMGYNGRSCILRALCESGERFMGTTTTMVEELVRSVFSFPSTKVLSFEPSDLHDYDAAHRSGKNNVRCSTAYRDCSISLIELAFGRYSKPWRFM